MSAPSPVSSLKELVELVKMLERREVTYADAYKARVAEIFKLPPEKIDNMTNKWVERGKPFADRVHTVKAIYHDWKRRHENVDPGVKLRVWFAMLKCALGLQLRYDEYMTLVRYGLDRVLREKGFSVRYR